MNLSRIFIERPIMTTLITFVSCSLALWAFVRCRLQRFPAWTIQRYRSAPSTPGANPETIVVSLQLLWNACSRRLPASGQ